MVGRSDLQAHLGGASSLLVRLQAVGDALPHGDAVGICDLQPGAMLPNMLFLLIVAWPASVFHGQHKCFLFYTSWSFEMNAFHSNVKNIARQWKRQGKSMAKTWQ